MNFLLATLFVTAGAIFCFSETWLEVVAVVSVLIVGHAFKLILSYEPPCSG